MNHTHDDCCRITIRYTFDDGTIEEICFENRKDQTYFEDDRNDINRQETIR